MSAGGTAHSAPDRNLALELVRVTEAAAISAARLMGRGDNNAVDAAAVDAMRSMLNSVPMNGVVVIGEGEKDAAPMLFNGEQIGDGTPPHCDIAVDPVDGTKLTALGRAGALAVIALADRGSMYQPGPCVYIDKIAVGPGAKGAVDLDLSPAENLRRVAAATGKNVHDLTVVILDRDRHADLIAAVRTAGARVRLIPDGDIAAAISTAWPDSGIDVLLGIGGTPEGVISAAALKCMGGEIQGRLWARDAAERRLAEAAGLDLERKLGLDDLVASDNCVFAATGVTDGDLLKGVRFTARGPSSQSLVMRSKSGTVRLINTNHRHDKLKQILN